MNPLSEFSSRLIPLSTGHSGLRTTMHVQIRENSCNSCLDFVSSDESLDRYNEVISAAGWKLDNYRRNPVFQNAHQTGDILHTLGRAVVTELRSSSPALQNSNTPFLFQTIEFACDVNPMARIAYGLYKGQFLNAVSVGFVPLRWKDASEGSAGRAATGVQENSLSAGGEGRGEVALSTINYQLSTRSAPRRIFLEQELLEVSAVAIPANPNALALGLNSGAVEKSDMKEVVELFRSALGGRPRDVPARSNSQIFQALKDFRTILRS